MKKTLLLMGSVLTAVSLFAQMPPEPPEGGFDGGPGPRHGERRGGPGMMPMRDTRSDAEAELLKKYPKEMAELQKERAANEAKFQELAKKAGIQLPDADFVRREKMAAFRTKYAAELKAIEEQRKTDPRGAMMKMHELMQKEGISFGPGRGGRPEAGDSQAAPVRSNMRQRMEEKLKEEMPEEYAEYEKLRKEDPRAADRKLRELMLQLRKKTTGK